LQRQRAECDLRRTGKRIRELPLENHDLKA